MAGSLFFNWWQFWKVYSLVVGKRRSLQTVHIHAVLLFVTEPSLELQMLRKRGKERLSTNRMQSLWRSVDSTAVSISIVKLVELTNTTYTYLYISTNRVQSIWRSAFQDKAPRLSISNDSWILSSYTIICQLNQYIYKQDAVTLTHSFFELGPVL